MSICPNCNTTLSEDAVFCNACGAKVSATAPQQTPANNVNRGKLHCPQCKSHNLNVTTESSVTSAATVHSRGGRFSSTHVSNNHQTFWVCGDCGTKFRNIQSLEEEIKKYKNYPLIWFIISAVAAVLCLNWLINSANNPFGFLFGGYVAVSGICAIIFLCYGFYYKSKLKKMRAELDDLKIRCFN